MYMRFQCFIPKSELVDMEGHLATKNSHQNPRLAGDFSMSGRGKSCVVSPAKGLVV